MEFRLRVMCDKRRRPRSAATRGRSLRQSSFDGDAGGGGFGKAVIADPFEVEFSTFGRDREKRDERIGSGRREEIGAEDLLALKTAGEARDDIARHHLAGGGAAIAGFHDMRHQRLDLDDVARFGFLRNIDQRGGHQITSSVQAASVTTTSAVVDQNEPSDSFAIAVIFWLSARRTRVDTCARPARGPRWKLPRLGCGFFSLKT